MSRGNPTRARGRPLNRPKIQRRRLKAPAGWRPRPIRIHNGHPRLRLDRRTVIAAIHCLDSHAAEILGQRATRQLSTLDFRLSTLSARPSALAPRPSPALGVPPGELSLAFLTDPALARLHAAFLGDRSPTDVITFAGTPALGGAATGVGLAGEICVSADAAHAFAAKNGRDFSAEMTLYITHGWLHLAGHDDLSPAGKRRMRAAEARAMALLRRHRLIPAFAFAS
jgi:probable rRNA maturation factor